MKRSWWGCALATGFVLSLTGCLDEGPRVPQNSQADPALPEPDASIEGNDEGTTEPSVPEDVAGGDALTGTDGSIPPVEATPCLVASPTIVDFGATLVGDQAVAQITMSSCGEEPVTVHSLQLAEGAEAFDLSLSVVPLVDGRTPADDPLVLQPGQSVSFEAYFAPSEVHACGPDGEPLKDHGVIEIESDASEDPLLIDVWGYGKESGCPAAVIGVEEGEQVIPQTVLHLVGSQSYGVGGCGTQPAKYLWSVDQPPGSQSVFLPSAGHPDPAFEANVAGTYLFRLDVWDEDGAKSCSAAEYQVTVTPEQAIHVELMWHTPDDPDETDEGAEAGADLDLHFLHPFATGIDVDGDGAPDGYFDNPFDSFWFNPAPDWGSHDPMVDDDPSLDRDDTDGAGPENVNLGQPEDGLTYRIGVHYWNDHGWGRSQATVRVYIHGELAFEAPNVELVNHDLWEVATIEWPSGTVESIVGPDGGPKLIPDYVHPLFLGQ